MDEELEDYFDRGRCCNIRRIGIYYILSIFFIYSFGVKSNILFFFQAFPSFIFITRETGSRNERIYYSRFNRCLFPFFVFPASRIGVWFASLILFHTSRASAETLINEYTPLPRYITAFSRCHFLSLSLSLCVSALDFRA